MQIPTGIKWCMLVGRQKESISLTEFFWKVTLKVIKITILYPVWHTKKIFYYPVGRPSWLTILISGGSSWVSVRSSLVPLGLISPTKPVWPITNTGPTSLLRSEEQQWSEEQHIKHLELLRACCTFQVFFMCVGQKKPQQLSSCSTTAHAACNRTCVR